MQSALAVDGQRGPSLPGDFGGPPQQPQRQRYQSPLPPDWSDGTKRLRELADSLEQLIGSR
jgi:penicillin-binding protein 1A